MSSVVSRMICCTVAFFVVAIPAFSQNPIQQAIGRVNAAQQIVIKQVQNASVETQAKVNEVPAVSEAEVHQVTAPQKPDKTIEVVSDSQKGLLVAAVTKFAQEKRGQQGKFAAIALTLLVAGAILATVGGICGLLKYSTTAGIVGLITAAIVAAPGVYPVSALADFYNSLATQAVALQTDCALKTPFTLDDYKSAEGQLKLLIIYEGEKRPGFLSAKISTEELAKQLQSWKTNTAIASGSQ